MSTHKYIDRICCAVLALTLLFTMLFMNAGKLGIIQEAETSIGYEDHLFDTSKVHTIDIVMDDWDSFLETAEQEEYTECAVVIDNESYKNVAIRAKGNTSLTQVSNYGNDRYSFKIEFDHYDSTKTYHGLDKLSLNNIIQDNTYMKDYLCYQMMNAFDVDSPLCSYVYITVNGEDWGLYLAVEGVEDSFLTRNYGADSGELYKPDSQSMGGGRGNGGDFDGDFDMDEAEQQLEPSEDTEDPAETTANTANDTPQEYGSPPSGQGGGKSIGSDDVSLIYSDDSYDSYQNIFDNAKTDITDSDKDRLIASLKALNEGEDIEDVVNVEEVIRYFVVHNFVCNFDSYTGSMIHNYYLYEEDGQLSMIPWDYNLAFGGFVSSSDATSLVNYPIDTPVSGGDVDSRPMLAWIFSNDTYTQMYHEYFAEFLTYFDSGEFSDMIDSVSQMIAPYVESDPTKFCTYEEFETGVSTLKEFCLLRAESIQGQLDGTIPSTSDGQEQDSSSLIDASSITISDMGSMNNGGDGGGMGAPNGTDSMEMPEDFDPSSDTPPSRPDGQSPPDMQTQTDFSDTKEDSQATQTSDSQTDNSKPEPPNQANNDSGSASNDMQQPPSDRSEDTNASVSASDWIWLAGCSGLLAAGILIALFYHKKS